MSAATVSAIWSALPAISTSASRTNSVSDWTSEVRRETSTPTRSCSKKPSGRSLSLSKPARRSASRNRSPADAANSTCARTTNGFTSASATNVSAATLSAWYACFLIPASTA
jgi:hypothetical protein